MSVPLFFTLIGGIILAGFFANLLFRVTKIPSVLLLIAMGVVLGPVTGFVRSDALLGIAPLFGALALLIILFEGGLELEIGHVVREAPRASILAVVVFALSFVTVAAFGHWVAGLSPPIALLLGALLAATSPAICIPVVSGLSVRQEIKTIVKLEAVLGEVLLIVSVILVIDAQTSGAADPLAWMWSLVRSLLVALIVSSVAGILWSRLVGWMGREPLAYMLTLGMVCLLYVSVEELGGSPAIATLLFGLILANMQSIAARFGGRFRELFGVNLREEQFVLDQFMLNITAELSFLVRTFFFVYLGLLLDFSTLSSTVVGLAFGMFALLLVSRRVGIGVLSLGRSRITPAESAVILALAPRGLATAVVALLPLQAKVEGAEILPVYAFVMIVITNVYMTGGVLFAVRRLQASPATVDTDVPASPAELPSSEGHEGARRLGEEPARSASHLSPAAEFADEPHPASFSDWMARVFGLRIADRETEYVGMVRSSQLSEPLFWVQMFLGAAICALGLVLDQVAIVVGGTLIVPLVRPVIASGLALAVGDVYLLLKLMSKLLLAGAMVVLLSAFLIDALPFEAMTAEVAARTRPTVLDFLVALFGGMSGAALISLRRHMFQYLPGAVIGITLLPALCVMGFGLGGRLGGQVFRGGGLLFTANLFAAVLGAGLVLLMVGIPQAADCESVRRWKESELSRPFVRAIFGRLRLHAVLGRTGSVRARIVVVTVFLLSVLTPLQFALTQLSQELRVRQAVSRAQEMFEVQGRSVILQSASSVADDGVTVRMQVATNELFTAADIRRFEERVRDRSGRKARLDLVQTLGDVGQADVVRSMLTRKATEDVVQPRSSADVARELRVAVERTLRDVPLPEGIAVVAIRSDLTGAGEPRLEITYLSEKPLGGDAGEMVARLIEQRGGIGRERVVLRFVPASHAVRVSGAGVVRSGQDRTTGMIAAMLATDPVLVATLHPPSELSGTAVAALRNRMLEGLSLDEGRLTVGAPSEERGVASLRLSVGAQAVR